jgi:hypothetical protein
MGRYGRVDTEWMDMECMDECMNGSMDLNSSFIHIHKSIGCGWLDGWVIEWTNGPANHPSIYLSIQPAIHSSFNPSIHSSMDAKIGKNKKVLTHCVKLKLSIFWECTVVLLAAIPNLVGHPRSVDQNCTLGTELKMTIKAHNIWRFYPECNFGLGRVYFVDLVYLVVLYTWTLSEVSVDTYWRCAP